MLNKVTALIIMDGFGYPENKKLSAINDNNTKHLQQLASKYPSGLISASEGFVGLPNGQTGTSDVGHYTIGIGRIIDQPRVLIDNAIENKEFFKNPSLLEAMKVGKENSLHLIGIVSDGGVHSHVNHLLALIDMAKQNKVKNVYIHFVSDGRDTPIHSAEKYFYAVQQKINETGVGEIVDVIGRFYAMDRDNNWDRLEVAYNALVHGTGHRETDLLKGIEKEYKNGQTDEFLEPVILVRNNKAVGRIQKNDAVICFNYRQDRERQLAYVFAEKSDLKYISDLNLFFVGLMQYDKNFKNTKYAYKIESIKNCLTEVLSKNGYKQLKIAETEKYPYVTSNFNGGSKKVFKNEKQVLIPSEKRKTYVDIPEMGAYKITDVALSAIKSEDFDFIVINFANCDMVGHSGNKVATEKAVDVVDNCVYKVVEAVRKAGGRALVTADHGNADMIEYPDGSPCTSHTKAKVPFILVDDESKKLKIRRDGGLSDIAPTILDLLKIEKPKEMSGTSLLIRS